MNVKIGALVLTVSMVLGGCNDNKEVETTSSLSLLSSPKVAVAPAGTAGQQAQKLPKPDRRVSDYGDLNGEPAGMALTYIVLARSAAVSDDDKLNRLSPAYYNETDVFKKKELAKTELPRIDAILDEYRRQNYYSLPVSAYSQKPMGLTNVSLGHYDFNTNSFPLISYGQQYCWASTLRNQQGAALKILPSDIPCSLPVADETLAKTIESARAQNRLYIQGTLYLFVPRTNAGTALALVARAHIDVMTDETKPPLASFDL